MDSQDGWEAAMHTDVHCASTVQAMEAGSIGALLGAPKDCIPMSKKPQGYWAYGPPGGGAWKEPTPEENMARYKQWRKDHPKPDNSWAQRDVHRQEELAEGRSRLASADKSSGDRGAARRRAGVDREARARVMALEAEVKEATASEKRALRQEEELQAQNMGFVRANGAAKQTQAALRAQVQELKTADKTQMKQMARVQRHEAALILQEKGRDSRLRARLSRLQTADSLKALALERLHSAFERGKASVKHTARSQGGSGGESRLEWYVPWTHGLASAVKAAEPTP